MPLPSPKARWALTPPFHPYQRDELFGGMLSVALSVTLSEIKRPQKKCLVVNQYSALWSPDFPPVQLSYFEESRTSDHPSRARSFFP